MAKAISAFGKFSACQYSIDEVSSFLCGRSGLPPRLFPTTPKETQ